MRLKYFLFFGCFFFLLKCTVQEEKPGEKLARTYCSNCHQFPEPSLLSKDGWKNNVLPAMSRLLGIDYMYGLPYVPGKASAVPLQDWNMLAKYYLDNAPDSMPSQNRPHIKDFTNLFQSKGISTRAGEFPASSFVKIDTANHWIFQGNAFDSTLDIYDASLKLITHCSINGVLIDMDFENSLGQPGERSGVLTNIGIMNPNDLTTGTVDSFQIAKDGSIILLRKFLDSLPRPVQTLSHDLNGDGLADYLVCGFGNHTGALFMEQKEKSGGFKKQTIRGLPGAIKVYIDDFNHDGLPDIMALMAQAQEGIFLFLNKGNGSFDTKELISFPPIYGSSYFELDDFNGDGFKDILYTCGDNADYTGKFFKNYHGLYIYLNDGKNNFSQKYFFAIDGCYKAIARDFDKDGDLDIAAISYFPDTLHQPQESFVYLEQTRPFEFKPSTIREFDEGKWLTMDAGDVDGDGDDDIILGSLIPPLPAYRAYWLKSSKQRGQLLLLENKIKNR